MSHQKRFYSTTKKYLVFIYKVQRLINMQTYVFKGKRKYIRIHRKTYVQSLGYEVIFHLQPRWGWGGKTLSYPKTHLFSKGTTTIVVIQGYKCKHNAVKPVLAVQIVALE